MIRHAWWLLKMRSGRYESLRGSLVVVALLDLQPARQRRLVARPRLGSGHLRRDHGRHLLLLELLQDLCGTLPRVRMGLGPPWCGHQVLGFDRFARAANWRSISDLVRIRSSLSVRAIRLLRKFSRVAGSSMFCASRSMASWAGGQDAAGLAADARAPSRSAGFLLPCRASRHGVTAHFFRTVLDLLDEGHRPGVHSLRPFVGRVSQAAPRRTRRAAPGGISRR